MPKFTISIVFLGNLSFPAAQVAVYIFLHPKALLYPMQKMDSPPRNTHSRFKKWVSTPRNAFSRFKKWISTPRNVYFRFKKWIKTTRKELNRIKKWISTPRNAPNQETTVKAFRFILR